MYFPVTLTQGFNDVTVAIVPVGQPRPGFNYTNKIIYKNLGVAATSGTLIFIKDPAVAITSISESGAVTTPDGFSFNFNNLAPYETRTLLVTMSVPQVPTVNLGDLLTNNATITAVANDINLTNNAFANSQLVVASYDPNDIMEAHGGRIQFNQFSADDYLYYTIRFQNTGTANAVSVRLEDLLDSRFDANSIRMIGASHDYILERVNNHLVWKFNYINLVGAAQDGELSKGYVTFKIKLNPGFAVGDIIPNTASIYFDANPAVVTNTFNTVFVATLGTPDFNTNTIGLYPNPASTMITITNQNATESISSISIYDVSGKTIYSNTPSISAETTIDVSPFAKGMYLVEIVSESNTKIIKKLILK